MSAEKRVRVVQVVNSLAVAGAERSTVELAVALDPTRFDASILTVRGGPLREVADSAGIPVSVVGGEFDLRAPGVVSRMHAELDRLRPQIVHTHLIGSDIVGRLAARRAGVPILVSTQHDLYRRALVWRLYRRWTAGWIDAQIANAQPVAAYCTTELHVDPSRVHVIENGIDPARFAGAADTQCREPVFGTLGTLIPVKDQATAIRALARVRDTRSDARLLIAGEGPERGRLEELARELGLAGAVEFLGVVDAPAFLAEITALVHPSRQEAFGLAVAEAMAAGRPVIASDLPSLRTILDDGDAGVLAPAGDDAAFARAMLGLLEDPARCRDLARAGRARVEARYSARRMAREHEELYRQLVTDLESRVPARGGERR